MRVHVRDFEGWLNPKGNEFRHSPSEATNEQEEKSKSCQSGQQHQK